MILPQSALAADRTSRQAHTQRLSDKYERPLDAISKEVFAQTAGIEQLSDNVITSTLGSLKSGAGASRAAATIFPLQIARPFSTFAWPSSAAARSTTTPISAGYVATSSPPQVGLNLPAVRFPDDLAALPFISQMGARWIRVDVYWAVFEPYKGRYDLTYVQQMQAVVMKAASYGLRVLFVVMGTPSWDQPSSRTGAGSLSGIEGANLPPTNVNDFGRAMGWLSAQFAPSEVAWEIWNEPNITQFLSTESPSVYAALACSAYAAIKIASPAATVVVGAVSGEAWQWLASAFRDGLARCSDVVSEHPYVSMHGHVSTTWQPPVYASEIHALMLKYGIGNEPMWITEVGWCAAIGSRVVAPGCVSPLEQANFSARYLAEIAASFPYVTNVIFYNGTDSVNNSPFIDWAGFLTATMKEKPVFTAVRSWIKSDHNAG